MSHGNTKHGFARRGLKTREYKTWESMMRRCYMKSQDSYENYGGRGILVCEEWHDFEIFFKEMGIQEAGMTIERKDVNKNYCKDNCTWVSKLDQQRNKSNTRWIEFNGIKKCLSEWASDIGVKPKTLRARIDDYKWPIERALTTKILTPVENQKLSLAARKRNGNCKA